MKAKKSLGQHFLTSTKALSQIIDAADPNAGDIVLEIGPGKGVLTKELVQHAGKVIAVEKDAEMVSFLHEAFANVIEEGHLDVIEGDILKFNPELLRFYENLTYKIVANIPYYITGAIIEKFLSATHQPACMVLLMQKEVADRIVAKDKKESVLSMAVKAYGTPRIVAKVPRGAFSPAPKVDSAIVEVGNISRDFFSDCDEQTFFKILKAIFGKKRKQIGGSLSDFLKDKERATVALEKSHIQLKARPEDLSLSDWKKLVQSLGTL